jgi:DNA-3-methyladenine glycosylase II
MSTSAARRGNSTAQTNIREEIGPFDMRPRAPFRLDLTVWALRRLPINEMDRWDGTTYRRVLTVDGSAVEAAARQLSGGEHPRLEVSLVWNNTLAATAGPYPTREAGRAVAEVRHALTRLLGLDLDLEPFYRLASADEHLGRLASQFMGVKPPRFPSVIEAVVNGIACQQLSLTVGIHLLNRLSSVYGTACGEGHAFPSPEELAKTNPQSLRSLGFSTQKAQNIIAIARAVASGELDLESLHGLEDAAAEEALDRLRGVGRWTAQYVALRALGRLDVFPADDVGSQNKIKQWLSLEQRPDYEETTRLLARFRPYRGLIYFHLLLKYLAGQGLVAPSNEDENESREGARRTTSRPSPSRPMTAPVQK